MEIGKFLQPPDPNLLCVICHEVMSVPQRTPCGHVFCKNCIIDWLSMDKTSCVTCRSPLLFADLQLDRVLASIIGNLKCRCPNRSCPWRGKYSRRHTHVKECAEELICCPHSQFGCSFKNKRRHLATHLVTCKYEQVKTILYAQRNETIAVKKRVREQEARVSQLESVILERSGRWLRDVRIDDKIDAKDSRGRWYESTVIGIPDDVSLEIHFDGWNEKHDENVLRDSGRLAPLHSHSNKRRKRRRTLRNWRDFEHGDMIDGQDSIQHWYEAVVVDVNHEEDLVYIHFEGWPIMWDEWLPVDSERLAPLRTHSVIKRNQPTEQRLILTPRVGTFVSNDSPPTTPNTL